MKKIGWFLYYTVMVVAGAIGLYMVYGAMGCESGTTYCG